MNIGNRVIGPSQPPYIIAEIGVNHDGSVDRAIELVESATRAGADAVKLQLFETDRLLSRAAKLAAYQARSGEGDPFEMLRKLELTVAQMKPIVHTAKQAGLDAIVTVFSVELVTAAQSLGWDAYKTASPDIINQPLIHALLETKRPLLLSTGAASLAEIEMATKWLGDHPHLLLHCVSAYPVADDRASLLARHSIAKINPNALGYSDHTAAIDTGALAVASGACLLEKHLTHDRRAAGPDHAASLDPPQFAEYVRLAHRAHQMLGPCEKTVLDIEEDVRQVSRQSLTSTRSLASGAVLNRSDLTIKRPGTGVPPHQLQNTVGRTLKRAVEADMPITEDNLA